MTLASFPPNNCN